MLLSPAPDRVSAPLNYYGAPTLESASLWRDLRYAVVPGDGPYMRDMVLGRNGVTTTGNAPHGITGEAQGRAFRVALGAGIIGLDDGTAPDGLPTQAPFSCF